MSKPAPPRYRTTNWHLRSRVETKMHCFKLLGERLMARDFDRQVAELQISAAILNHLTALGNPQTRRIAYPQTIKAGNLPARLFMQQSRSPPL